MHQRKKNPKLPESPSKTGLLIPLFYRKLKLKDDLYYSGKKKRHTQKGQVLADQISGRIIATAFCAGKRHDLALYRASQTAILSRIQTVADSGYQGIQKDHNNSETPRKKSEHHPLSVDDKKNNRALAQKRMGCEHIMGRLKVFRILAERYRNRRKRFGLRFNLISAIHNMEYCK